MLESLTATFGNPYFESVAGKQGFELYSKPRGSPDNVGSHLHAVHPVIRTNPVTGWKSIFPVGAHTVKINDVSEQESRHLLDWFVQLIYQNPEVQVRHKWHNPNDIGKSGCITD
jgi:alpha-ketoglutarate-dependent taurine dioxygenase